MDEAFSNDQEQSVIDDLERSYAALDPSKEEERGSLRHEIFAARLRRMERVSTENWKALEAIAGHSLRA